MGTILVTGATGFIGHHLFKHLGSLGYHVVGISKSGGKINGRNITKIDICNEHQVQLLFRRTPIEAVIHTAALISLKGDVDAKKLLTTNVYGTYNLLGQSVKNGVKKFIYSSSASVYDRYSGISPASENLTQPIDFYGASKLSGEYFANVFSRFKVQTLIYRYSSVYGPGQRSDSVLPMFLKKAMKNERLEIDGKGGRSQDFIYIKDVLQANLLGLNSETTGVFNIGFGEEISLLNLAKTIIDTVGSKSKIVLRDLAYADESRFYLNIDKARKALGYNPKYSLSMGIRDYLLEVKDI